MSFDFEKFAGLGKKLSSSSNEEDLRCSVSRGYYAIYHKVKDFLKDRSEYISHADLIKLLKTKPTIKQRNRLAQILQSMKEDRVFADYKKINEDKNIKFNLKYADAFWFRYKMFIDMLSKEVNEGD